MSSDKTLRDLLTRTYTVHPDDIAPSMRDLREAWMSDGAPGLKRPSAAEVEAHALRAAQSIMRDGLASIAEALDVTVSDCDVETAMRRMADCATALRSGNPKANDQ